MYLGLERSMTPSAEFSLAEPDTSRRRVPPHKKHVRSSNCGTLGIEKRNRRRGVLITAIMFSHCHQALLLCGEHNPLLSDDRPY